METFKEEQTQDTQEENNSQDKALIIPGAIVLAGIIIAGAIVWTNSPQNEGQQAAANTADFGNNLSETAKEVRPIDETDHVLGNPNAPVTIVEYSDFECPFCARFHPTLKKLLQEFPDVKWVYRHFPLTSIHSKALDAAVASECVAEQGGNDMFWQFTDGIFDNQNRLGVELYTELVQGLGLSSEQFITCFNSEKYQKHVYDDAQNALDSGGGGTPFNIVINSDGEVFPFSGALPYEQVKTIIESAING